MLLKAFSVLCAVAIASAWPDGAPCLHSTVDSMNPLEAAEHQGGLRLTDPPYTIEVSRRCYIKNQPLQVTLRGNTTSDMFKGFVIQPIIYKGAHQGRRMGEFLKLDDNGSWQHQCFKLKDSVTHSHNEKKKKISLWWKPDLESNDYVQFVATVVKAQREFWVKSVVSIPLPPCTEKSQGLSSNEFSFSKPTAPPPVH
uniref:Reelin domain-containing protein n=1 Tax=Syphacia muris TaxID=451379 RepID=A0A0N5AEJ7_9BILA